jgi:serine/threonine protein kinase
MDKILTVKLDFYSYRLSRILNDYVQEFLHEALTWQQLSHPNILPLYGVNYIHTNLPKLCLASPWMENGNIVHFLAECAPATRIVFLWWAR